MELKDTVELMNSEDYKDRFKAEYYQTKIRQYDITDNYIRDWDSMCMCSRELRISQSSISDCCNGKRKSAGNFLFRKVD